MKIENSIGRKSKNLPKKVDVVIIGSGIIGTSAALFLAKRGYSVVVCEKGVIGGEQSSRNWGWCRKMGRDPVEIPLAVESTKLWEGMNSLVASETGYRKTGIFYLCKTHKEIAKYEAWLGHARKYNLDSVILNRKQLSNHISGTNCDALGALYTSSDGRAEPSLATLAIASAARKEGVRIFENCAVRGVDTTAGSVSGVVTEHGGIDCDNVVMATGAWTRLFCGNMDINFPQLRVFGSVLRTEPIEGAPEFAVAGSDYAFRKRLDGGYTVAQKNANIAQIVPDSFRLMTKFLPAFQSEGNEVRLRFGRAFFEDIKTPKRWSMSDVSPFENCRTLNPAPSQKVLNEGIRNLIQAFPVFRKAKIKDQWACAIDVTPDAVPVISPVPSVPGLIIASGFSGHGFGIGPGAGHLIADIISGSKPIVDPIPYNISRIVKF